MSQPPQGGGDAASSGERDLALGAEAGWWFDVLMLALILFSARTAWNRAEAAARTF